MASLVRGASSFIAALVILLGYKPAATDALPAINAAKVSISQSGPLTLINGKPANGLLFQLGDKGDTVFAVPYLDGKENGWSRSYYPNKQRRELRYYRNGWKQGEHKGWYPDGRLAYVYQFKDDVYNGVVKEWSPQGILFRDMNYERGIEVGRQVIRYADGKIKSNYVIKNGVRYGLLGTKNCVNVKDSIPGVH